MSNGAALGPPPARGRSAAVARRLAPHRVSLGAEREITVDRSNHCVVVDEAVFVKWFTPPAREPHRGLTIARHLATVGFTAMPELYGASVNGDGIEAIATEHLAAATDGWEWFFDEVIGWADRRLDRRQVIVSACQIGDLGGALHLALATPSDLIPEPVTAVDGRDERERCRLLLATALGEVDAAEFPDAHHVLHRCARRLRDMVESIPNGPVTAITSHGDLHVGQVLRAGERLALIDFDGNPLLPPDAAPVAQPAAVDLASLAQSTDHAVRMAQHRRPGQDHEFDQLAAAVSTSVCNSYRARLQAAGRLDLLDAELLAPLRAAQELHELVYSVRRLPRWAYAPTLALAGMFPEEVT